MLDALLGAFSNLFVARCLLLLTKHGRKRAFFVSSGITTLPNAFLAVCPNVAYRMVTVVVIASSPSFVCLWASYLSFFIDVFRHLFKHKPGYLLNNTRAMYRF